MKLAIYMLGGLLLLLLVLVFAGGVYLARTTPAPARRRNGLCAVPGCGRAAGHWKAEA